MINVNCEKEIENQIVQSIIPMKKRNANHFQTCQWKIEKCFVKSLLQTSQMIKEWHRHALEKLKIENWNNPTISIFNFEKEK